MKGELERVVADAGQTLKLSSKKWKWVKLPLREGGLGLQDLPLISLAAWMATMGAVARMATEMTTLVPGFTAPGLVRGWFTDDNDAFEQELARLATKFNRGDAPRPLCPSLGALETMPSQHALVAKIYAQQSKTLNKAALMTETSLGKTGPSCRTVSNSGQGCGSTSSPPSKSSGVHQ